MSAIVVVILALAGVVTAAISGVLGMAGGVTLLGVMAALLPARDVVPLHGVVQLASNLTRVFAFRRLVHRTIFAVYALPTIAGVALATWVRSDEQSWWFRPAVGLFILAVLVWRRYAPTLRRVPLWSYAPLGLCVGLLSIFVGATGPLLAPFFLRDDFDKEEVIATQAACQTWAHLLKIPAFLSIGFDYLPHALLLGVLLAAVIAGTYLGKSLLARLSQESFVVLFHVVLGAMALYLLATGLAPIFR